MCALVLAVTPANHDHPLYPRERRAYIAAALMTLVYISERYYQVHPQQSQSGTI